MENYRKHGPAPYSVLLLHGGPGDMGGLTPVAKEISRRIGTIESLQTRLTVDELIEESRQVIMNHTRIPVTLVGHSWGAWLGILITGKHPGLIKRMILISSGPFDKISARGIMQTRLGRLNPGEQKRLFELSGQLSEDRNDKNDLFLQIARILDQSDIYEPVTDLEEFAIADYAMYEAIWPRAAEMRDSGYLLSVASAIACPVIAIHGDYDPHPANGVRIPLSENLKNFRFVLLEQCGHYPWKEKYACERFYQVLTENLTC